MAKSIFPIKVKVGGRGTFTPPVAKTEPVVVSTPVPDEKKPEVKEK